MGRWYTTEERETNDRLLRSLRYRWIGQVLDYGEFTRTVADVTIDDSDRIYLDARGAGENCTTREPLSKWDD